MAKTKKGKPPIIKLLGTEWFVKWDEWGLRPVKSPSKFKSLSELSDSDYQKVLETI